MGVRVLEVGVTLCLLQEGGNSIHDSLCEGLHAHVCMQIVEDGVVGSGGGS